MQRGVHLVAQHLLLTSKCAGRWRLHRCFQGGKNTDHSSPQNPELDSLKTGRTPSSQKPVIDLEAEALREEFVRQRRDPAEPFKVQSRNDRNKPLLTDRPTTLNLKQFEVLSPTEANPNDHPDRPKGVMDFIDQRMALKNGNLVVKGVFPDAFNVSNIIIFGGVLLFNNQLFSWDVTQGNDIRTHHFDILQVIKPSPAYIIVGTGENKMQLSPEIMEKLYSFKARVDVVDTFRAVSTFNICSGDGMNVVAFMVPGTESSNQVEDDFGKFVPKEMRI